MVKMMFSLSERAASYLRSKYTRKGDLSAFVERLLLDAEAEEAGVKP